MPETKFKKKRQPLFHVIKRPNIAWYHSWLIRIGSVIFALAVACLILYISTKASPITIFAELYKGCFGSKRRIWVTFKNLALLLITGLALVPAFRMKFWNLGGNGQILIGGLASIMCMFYLGNAGVPDWVIVIVSIVSSILAGAIWAVVPALFKAFFNTNESLFTLMLNYVAAGLVSAFIALVVTTGSGVLNPLEKGHLPKIYNVNLLPILVAFVVLIIVFVYLRFGKHGYELEVVGESPNTARYIGINVKKVIIRTLCLSGALCGLVGLLITAGIDYTITVDSAKNMGFTAIMVAWLAKFNPFTMVVTSALVTFISTGMSQVQSTLKITNDSVTSVITGLVYFFIIASEFFTSYKLVLTNHKPKNRDGKPSTFLRTLTDSLVMINPFKKKSEVETGGETK